MKTLLDLPLGISRHSVVDIRNGRINSMTLEVSIGTFPHDLGKRKVYAYLDRELTKSGKPDQRVRGVALHAYGSPYALHDPALVSKAFDLRLEISRCEDALRVAQESLFTLYGKDNS